jgi:hypothetical protein
MMPTNCKGGEEGGNRGGVDLGGGLREVQVSGKLAAIPKKHWRPLTWFWLRVRGVVGVWALL